MRSFLLQLRLALNSFNIKYSSDYGIDKRRIKRLYNLGGMILNYSQL